MTIIRLDMGKQIVETHSRFTMDIEDLKFCF